MDFQLFIDWFAETTFLGISLASWSVALAAVVASHLAMTIALRFAASRMRLMASRTETHVDNAVAEVLGATNRGLIFLVALLIGASLLDLPPRWAARTEHLWFIAVALQMALWLNRAVTLALAAYVAKHTSTGTPQVSASATLLSWTLRTVLWATLLLAMLSNLGVNITAFVASLGVGGVAVALAVQNILGDLFASLSIAVDKPFEVGDFITFGSVAGSVENVGLKTTRIRSISGEQIVVSNTELLKQTINNYKRMSERRIVMKFGVALDATTEQAAAIPKVLKQIIESSGDMRFDRAHLLALGNSALEYEVVYFVKKADYNLYMDQQHMINLRLLEELQTLGTSLAVPTRKVQLMRRPGNPQAAARDDTAGNSPPSTPANAPVPAAP